MWMEVKAMFSVLAIIFIAIVLSQVVLLNFLLGFLLIMAMGLVVIGDVFIGWKITSTNADKWIERPPGGKELGVIFTLTGLIDLVWADKKPEGKREFVYNKQEASVINKGDYPIHTLAGARGFIGHESQDINISLFDAKATDIWSKKFGSDNIKEVYYKARKEDEV